MLDVILNNIKEYLRKRIMSLTYKCLYNKKDVLARRIEAYTLFLTTDNNIIDIEKYIRNKYLFTTQFTQTKRDFTQYNYILKSPILRMKREDIEKRFEDDAKGVEERMMFRIELLKEGWDIDKIESYIYKYLLKCNMPEIDDNVYYYYQNIISNLNLKITNKGHIKKGRPSLPPCLIKYIKHKNAIKIKNRMNKIYKNNSLFESIKPSFLNEEDIQKIENMFIDKNDPTLLKIKNLYIRDI